MIVFENHFLKISRHGALMQTIQRLRVLRLAGYRCQYYDGSVRCGAPAANVAHPSPRPAPESFIAVCDHHLAVLYAEVS